MDPSYEIIASYSNAGTWVKQLERAATDDEQKKHPVITDRENLRMSVTKITLNSINHLGTIRKKASLSKDNKLVANNIKVLTEKMIQRRVDKREHHLGLKALRLFATLSSVILIGIPVLFILRRQDRKFYQDIDAMSDLLTQAYENAVNKEKKETDAGQSEQSGEKKAKKTKAETTDADVERPAEKKTKKTKAEKEVTKKEETKQADPARIPSSPSAQKKETAAEKEEEETGGSDGEGSSGSSSQTTDSPTIQDKEKVEEGKKSGVKSDSSSQLKISSSAKGPAAPTIQDKGKDKVNEGAAASVTTQPPAVSPSPTKPLPLSPEEALKKIDDKYARRNMNMGTKDDLINPTELKVVKANYTKLKFTRDAYSRVSKAQTLLKNDLSGFAFKHNLKYLIDDTGAAVVDNNRLTKGSLTRALFASDPVKNPNVKYPEGSPCLPITPDEIQFIKEAQVLWLTLNREYGGFIDLIAFSKEEGFEGLAYLFKMSRLSDPKIDDAINEWLYDEHMRNRPTKTPSLALVQGAGPIGLFTAAKLVETGTNVTLVNDREDYTRKQIVRVDPRWVAELQFFLGTKFNDLFSLYEGHINRNDNVGEMNISSLEKPLKERLENLERYINGRLKEKLDQANPPLQLSFGERVTKITAKDNGYVAECEKKDGNKTSYPFNLLVFAGGPGDRLRNEVLPPVVTATEAKEYGVSVWNKLKDDRNYLPTDAQGFPKFRDEISYGEMGTRLKNRGFDKWIKDEKNLPDEIKNQFGDFSEQIKALGGKCTTRQFENLNTIYLASEMPAPFVALKQALQNEIKKAQGEKNQPLENSLKRCLKELDMKWFDALISQFGKPHEFGFVNDGPNVGSFPVSQAYAPQPVIVDRTQEIPTIFAAVGDSLVAPHFFSGSGLSSGRAAVDSLADEVKKYNDAKEHLDPISLADKTKAFVDGVTERYQTVIDFTLKRGSPFLKPLSEDEIDAIKVRNMTTVLDKQVNETAGKTPGKLKEREYILQKNNIKNNVEYVLTYKTAISTIEMADFLVDEQGSIQMSGGGVSEGKPNEAAELQSDFHTFYDLLRYLVLR